MHAALPGEVSGELRYLADGTLFTVRYRYIGQCCGAVRFWRLRLSRCPQFGGPGSDGAGGQIEKILFKSSGTGISIYGDLKPILVKKINEILYGAALNGSVPVLVLKKLI